MSGVITVIGLGPASTDLMTTETVDAISAHSRRFVRTFRHPAAAAVADAVSFDSVYEQVENFEEVYETICERLVAAAEDGDLLYAVPGSPLVLERTVDLLSRRCEALRVLPAMSFLDLAWARLGIDPIGTGVRLVDGLSFAESAAGRTGPLLVAQCHARWVLSRMKLAVENEPGPVVVLQRLGLVDESVREVAWADLDRTIDADHLTSVFVPELREPMAASIVRFDELVRTLRQRCPWDREQTHASLRRHLLEETYETLEALDARACLDDNEVDETLDAHLLEELGDLLYQIWFHIRLASERGAFTLTDVSNGVCDKLVARHPHVFGDVVADDIAVVRVNWETRKKLEKGRASVMDGLPPSLPALLRAVKVLKRADTAGLTAAAEHGLVAVDCMPFRSPEAAADASEDALSSLRSDPCERHLGGMLLATVELSRCLGLDPEDALRAATNRIEQLFRSAERAG